MAATSYLYLDYFKDITSTDISIENGAAADKEDANYPIENSQDEQIALTTRTDDKTNIRILFDINSASGAKKALKVFFIGNHNFTGGSVKIYSYTANDYATGQSLEATVAIRELDMYTRIASPSTERYWEIDLSNNGNVTSGDNYYEWGRIMCYDDLVQLTEVEGKDKGRAYGFKNIVNVTDFGIRWIYRLYKKREEFRLIWPTRAATTLPSELRTLFEAIYGNAYPFVYIPDLSNTDCYYVFSVNDKLEWTEIYGSDSATSQVEGFQLDLMEEIRGQAS